MTRLSRHETETGPPVHTLFLKQWIYSHHWIQFNACSSWGTSMEMFFQLTPRLNSSIITSYFCKVNLNSILLEKNYIFKVEMAIPKFQIEFWTATPPHPCSWTATRVSHMHGCLRHTFAPSLSPPKNISRNPRAKSCDPDLWILMLTYGYLWGISMGYAAFIHFQVWPDCDDWHSEHDASTISASTYGF